MSDHWSVPAADPADSPARIDISMATGDLELSLTGFDGHWSEGGARKLAAALTEAADELHGCHAIKG